MMDTNQWIGAGILLLATTATCINEQRLIHSAKGVEEARLHVVSLASPVVRAANEGQLVHFTGLITTDPQELERPESTATRTPYVMDELFGVAARGVRLYRTVEMLQWVETEHSTSPSTGDYDDEDRDDGFSSRNEYTYTYSLEWRAYRVDSEFFHYGGYYNPPRDAWIYEAAVFEPGHNVVVGEFTLTQAVLAMIERRDHVALTAENRKVMRNILDQRLGSGWEKVSALKDVVVGDEFFHVLSDDGSRYELGAMRISFDVVPASPVTISGQQKRDTIVSYPTSAGEPILLVDDGILTSDKLYDRYLDTKGWHNRFFRLFSCVASFIGVLVLHPQLVQALGTSATVVQKHLTCAIFGTGLTFSIVGANWLLFRPFWACALWIGGLSPAMLMMAFIKFYARRVKEQ